jgi:hypothetical protein
MRGRGRDAGHNAEGLLRRQAPVAAPGAAERIGIGNGPRIPVDASSRSIKNPPRCVVG